MPQLAWKPPAEERAQGMFNCTGREDIIGVGYDFYGIRMIYLA
jgi:hypothetical protein